MKEVIEFLKTNPNGYLATINNGKPQVRPWGFMLEEGGKIWFCTANTKNVFHQLQANPSVEFCTSSKAMAWLRIKSEVKFSQDLEMKRKIIECSPLVKNLYKTPDNPIFEIFCLEHGQATISDFSGQPPKEFTF